MQVWINMHIVCNSPSIAQSGTHQNPISISLRRIWTRLDEDQRHRKHGEGLMAMVRTRQKSHDDRRAPRSQTRKTQIPGPGLNEAFLPARRRPGTCVKLDKLGLA